MSLAEKVKSFPRRPGVYLFKDAKGAVLYVGKAKDLSCRVASYFVAGRDDRPQIAFLLRRTADIEFLVTNTEKEALLLENTFIKEHRPRYNISLRDDKSYVSIRVGMEHRLPGISLTRRTLKDGALYFGPYDSSHAAREAVEQIARFFRVRTCRDGEFANRVRPCLKYDIGRCTAPCVERVSAEDYGRQVEEAILFLSGRSRELMRLLAGRMREASEGERYEDAARLRDAIAMLRGVAEPQDVVRHGGGDHDAVGIARSKRRAAICLLQVRGGALKGRRIFAVKEACDEESALLEAFLLAHYGEGAVVPPRIFLPSPLESSAAMASILSERRGFRVKLAVPSRGEMQRLVELAAVNAREALAQRAEARKEARTLERLARLLKLKGAPEAIECVDISNLGGREAVGSLVAFVGGEPEKSRYRIYNIRTTAEPDDYAMMYEVLSRRFRAAVPLRGAREGRPAPDLLLVDGGKGQLAIAQRALKECGAVVPVASIAKGEKKGHADQIFIPNRKNPLNLKRGSKELLLLMRIRDEAHRFGIQAHRRKRNKAALT
jgi:excinuclease ABC subunit C